MGWIGCAIPSDSHDFFSYFQDNFFWMISLKPHIRNACTFLPLNISAVGSVNMNVCTLTETKNSLSPMNATLIHTY